MTVILLPSFEKQTNRWNYLQKRHNGLCWCCREPIGKGEPFVVKDGGSNSKYYHKSCAERVRLI